MKKQYSRKQIREAIAYWERRLRKMDESGLPPGDEEIKDQVERVMEKASTAPIVVDADEFDRWREEAAAKVKDRIRDGDTPSTSSSTWRWTR